MRSTAASIFDQERHRVLGLVGHLRPHVPWRDDGDRHPRPTEVQAGDSRRSCTGPALLAEYAAVRGSPRFQDPRAVPSLLRRKSGGVANRLACTVAASRYAVTRAGTGRISVGSAKTATRAFSVTVGTIFHRTHMPLQRGSWCWRSCLTRRSPPARADCQRRWCASGDGVEHDAPGQGLPWLGTKTRGVFFMASWRRMKLSSAGRARSQTSVCDEDPKKRRHGRGTAKTPILGAVERGGRVVAEPAKNTTGRTIEDFINRRVD